MKYGNFRTPILIQTPYLYVRFGISKNTFNHLHFMNNMDKKIINDSTMKKSDWQLNDDV